MGGFATFLEETFEKYGPELEEAAIALAKTVGAAIGGLVLHQANKQTDAGQEKQQSAEKAEEASKAAQTAGDQLPDEDPEETEKECKQYKRLSKGEIKKLQDKGVDPHDLKPKYNGSRYDLFKTKDGDIVVLPKNGAGQPDPTGFNINDF